MPRTNSGYAAAAESQRRMQQAGPTPPLLNAQPVPADTTDVLRYHLREEHQPVASESLPPEWCDELYVRVPMCDVAWAKAIYYVPPILSNANELRGIFLPLSSQRFYAHVGTVLLILKSELLSIWLLMPDDEWYAAPMERIAHQPGWLDLIKRPLRSWVSMSYRHRILRACIEATHTLRLALSSLPRGTGKERQLRRELWHSMLYFHGTQNRICGYEGGEAYLVEQFRIWFGEMCAMSNVSEDALLAHIVANTTQPSREIAVLAGLLTRLEAHLAETPTWRQLPMPSTARDHIQQCATSLLRQMGCTALPTQTMPNFALEPIKRLTPLLRPMETPPNGLPD